MRHVVRMVVAIRFALSTRRDLLLEILALRHQLHVLVRSNRRFRPSDRLLWLVLRQLWPRWRDALVLVQPATVDRWHREGFHRCWRRRSRRPGRPRIDSECRGLIRRLAAEPVVVRCAFRLSSMRGRQGSLASTDLTWQASRSGSPSRRDQHPNQRRPGPADARTVRPTHAYAQRVDW